MYLPFVVHMQFDLGGTFTPIRTNNLSLPTRQSFAIERECSVIHETI